MAQGHNEFDVSFKGFALIKKAKGSYTMKKAYLIAEGIVEEWNDYLHGNVYGFITKDANDNEIDSCWGFYGDWENSGILDEAKNSIDYAVKEKLSNKINKVKTWIKNHVPFEIRQKESISLT